MTDFIPRAYVRRDRDDVFRIETVRPSSTGKTIRCRAQWSCVAGWSSYWYANYRQNTLDEMLEVPLDCNTDEALRLLLDEEAAR